MSVWSKAPLVRLTIPFMLGIISALAYFQIPLSISLFATTAFFCFALLLHYYQDRISYRFRFVSGLTFCLAAFFAGIAWLYVSQWQAQPYQFSRTARQGDMLLMKLSQPEEQREKSVKGIFDIQCIIRKGEMQPARGKALLYLEKDSESTSLLYGDLILIPYALKPIEKPRNPGEFNYSRYMSYKQVFHTGWFKSGEWFKYGRNEGNWLFRTVYAMKKKVRVWLQKSLPGKEERGIADALILGDTDELLPEVQADYAATGTLHVLSVSGLHVGAVAFLLAWLLKFLERNAWGRILRILLLLAALWSYAVITGLSPSVLRSVTMFSFMTVGLGLRKVTNIYNSIAASALILLLLDPMVITQVGFQLSYIAVIGIVWLYPKMKAWWSPGNKFLKWIWELMVMSLAAQIATFPLGLYYFNQFPVYFLLSNLLVVPASTVVLAFGAAFLAARLTGIYVVYHYAGIVLNYSIRLLNFSVGYLRNLPYSLSEGIYIDIFCCLLLYLFIVLLLFALMQKSKMLLKSSLMSLIIFFGWRSYSIAQERAERSVCIYAIPRHFLLSVKEGNDITLMGDSDLLSDKNMLKYHVYPYACRHFISKAHIISYTADSCLKSGSFYYNAPFGQIGNTRFLVLQTKQQFRKLQNGLPEMAFVVLDKNVYLDINALLKKVRFRRLILSAGNSYFRINKWKTVCEKEGIAYQDLSKDNSFVMHF